MSYIPNIPPKLFTASAVVIGYLLIDDTTANEQNALGNWLMLVAQVLCTNAFFLQVQQERSGNPSSNNIRSSTINNYNNGHNQTNNFNNNNEKEMSTEQTIIMMQKMIKALETEIENIKKEL